MEGVMVMERHDSLYTERYSKRHLLKYGLASAGMAYLGLRYLTGAGLTEPLAESKDFIYAVDSQVGVSYRLDYAKDYALWKAGTVIDSSVDRVSTAAHEAVDSVTGTARETAVNALEGIYASVRSGVSGTVDRLTPDIDLHYKGSLDHGLMNLQTLTTLAAILCNISAVHFGRKAVKKRRERMYCDDMLRE